jgi:hypothetical protein
VVIRRPQASEYDSVRALIGAVANETFKDLFAPNPVPLKFEDEDWPLARVQGSANCRLTRSAIATVHGWMR